MTLLYDDDVCRKASEIMEGKLRLEYAPFIENTRLKPQSTATTLHNYAPRIAPLIHVFP